MEQDDKKHQWIEKAELELAELFAELDRIDGHGVSQLHIRQRINELQASIDASKKLKAE